MATIDYKEKLKLAKEALESGSYDKETIEYIFPELRESEDEKIRKALKEYFINSFQNNGVAAICGVHIKDILAFLEKQGKTSPILTNSSNTGKVEQKPNDKVEPKFKVGNKIKLAKEPKYPAREIIAIQNDAYYFDEAIYLPFSRQDEWELVEQKPAETEKGTKGNNGEIPFSEQKQDVNIQINPSEYINDMGGNGCYLKNTTQASAWTEEDNINCTRLLYFLDGGNLMQDHKIELFVWLKSLKERYTWKPSDEQMTALRRMKAAIAGEGEIYKPLNSLYEDLKKLKE